MLHRSFELPHDATSVWRARDITRTCFAEAGYLGDQREAEIVASELVTNSLLHGDDPITFHLWIREDRLRIGVSDGSRVTPSAVHAASEADTSGRGLTVVEELALRWGSDPYYRGKLIWADVEW
jgi:anti-sigma regulatory factor (Ser/Thr protein kinase)